MDAEIVVGQLCFMKKVFRKFTRKHLYWSPFLIKRLCYRCFGVNFENLKTPILQNLCEWLLLWMLIIVQLASCFQVFNYNNYSKYLIIMFLKIQFNPLYQYANNFVLFIVTQIVNVLRANKLGRYILGNTLLETTMFLCLNLKHAQIEQILQV